MEKILGVLTKKVKNAFERAGYDAEYGIVTYSDRIDLCDFQCNGCFPVANQEGESPMSVAEKVSQYLLDEKEFETVEIVKPGFLNFKVKNELLINYLNLFVNSEDFLFPNVGNGKTIVIDYGGANVAKPLHIGHLRSAVIGESLKNIAKAGGYNVIADVHLGDWGLQMGLVITELRNRYPDLNNNINYINSFEIESSVLNEVYPTASAKSKILEDYKKSAQLTTSMLQSGDQLTRILWHKIIDVSKKDLKASYELLQTNFDYWYGESDAAHYIPNLIDILLSKNLLEDSDGAKVVRVNLATDIKEIPPVIIVKSDGSSIYATTDLATIIQRMKDFSPSKIWYVVDNRQNLHFTQVFRVASKANLVNGDTELDFLGFGTMNGSDGKPYKTRDGGIMQLNNLIYSTIEQAKSKIDVNNFSSSDDLNDTAKRIAIAAIKFGDLINHRSKDYIFDIDKFLSFEGKTGTYILYSITRINSILKKFQTVNSSRITFNNIHTNVERNLILFLIKCPEIHLKALNEKSPNLIAESAYQIAVLFSKFYANNNIILQENAIIKEDWLNILRYVKKTLEFQLYLLGIESVQKM